MSERTGVHEIVIDPKNPLAAPLLECSQSGEFLCLVLPDGRRVWVHSEDSLRSAASLIADPEFADLLKASASEFVCGDGLVLEAGENPQIAMDEVLRSSEFASLLEQAAADFARADGVVMDSSQRP